MSVTSSTHSSFNLEQEIKTALTDSKTALHLETLAAAGISLKNIDKLAKSTIKEAGSSATIDSNLHTLKQWAKEHSKSKSKVQDILDQIFRLENPDEAQREVKLFLNAGGKVKDVCVFIEELAKGNLPKDSENQIRLLENIAAVIDLEKVLPIQRGSKKGLFSSRNSKNEYKIEDAAKPIFDQLSRRTDLILEAAKSGHTEIALKLAGKNPDSADHHKTLTHAIQSNNFTNLQLLLTLGYDPNAVDGDRRSVLMFAIEQKCAPEVYEILLEHGANIEQADKTNATPLHYAVHLGNKPAVEILLKYGANINHKDVNWTTPLHRAKNSSSNSEEQLILWNKLIQVGADPTIKDLYKGSPCNTPLLQILFWGTNSTIERMFRGYPVIAEIVRNNPKNKVLEVIREHAFDLSKPNEEDAVFLPLEIPFLLQDPTLARNMMAILEPEEINKQVVEIREKYPQCKSFKPLSEAAVAPTKEHVLKFGALVSTPVPTSGDSDGSNTIKVKRLMVMLDKVLLKSDHPEDLKFEGDPGYRRGPKYSDFLKKPSDPGYRDLKTFRDVHGHTFTPLQLREKMECLLKDIENRQSKPGTPPSGEPEKLEHWYRYLESTLCEIIDIIDLEDALEASAKDPTPNASSIIEIALTGGHCGGWYMGESQKIKQQKSHSVVSLQDQIISTLSLLHQGICEGLIPRDYEQNTHTMNNILQVIDESAGIQDDQKRARFYFLDHITPLDRNVETITAEFWKAYHPTAIIDHLDHAVHFSKQIDKELIIDWLKENIPEDFEKTQLKAIESNLAKIGSLQDQANYLLDNHQILIPMPAPLEEQLLDHLIKQSENGEQYIKVISLVVAMSTIKDKSIVTKLIKQRYEIDLNPDLPLAEQVRDLFFAKLPGEVKQFYLEEKIEIESTSYEMESQKLKEKVGLNAKPLPNIQREIANWRALRFLESQISENGRISREALVYMLGKMGVFEDRKDMVHPEPAHVRFMTW